MVFDFYVAPGTILKEYMDERDITQKQLAMRLESSERHLSNLINGKVRLTEEFALRLEQVFPDVTAEMWMEIENKYRLKQLRNSEVSEEDLKLIAKDYQFPYLFRGLGYSLKQQYNEALKILGISSFKEAEILAKSLQYDFMKGEGKPEALLLWIKLCESEVEVQNDLEKMKPFDLDGFKRNVHYLKNLIYTENPELAFKNIRRFTSQFGIALVVQEAVPTSKVRGAAGLYQGRPVIYLSKLYNRLDYLYFALIHEVHHILNEDHKKGYHVNIERPEEEGREGLDMLSNDYARNFIIEKDSYKKLVDSLGGEECITEKAILAFSMNQKVIPSITLSFLQYDKIIKGYGLFSNLRVPIE